MKFIEKIASDDKYEEEVRIKTIQDFIHYVNENAPIIIEKSDKYESEYERWYKS